VDAVGEKSRVGEIGRAEFAEVDNIRERPCGREGIDGGDIGRCGYTD